MTVSEPEPPPANRVPSRFPGLSTVALIVCAVGIVVFGATFAYNNRIAGVAAAEARANSVVRLLAANIGARIEYIDIGLNTVRNEFQTRRPSLQIPDPAFEAFLDNIDTSIAAIDGYRIYDGQGRFVYGTRNPPLPGTRIDSRDYFAQAKARPTGELLVSRPILAQSSNRLIVVFARALQQADGSFAGVAVATLPAVALVDPAREADVGQGGVIAIYDDQGVMVARHPQTGSSENALGKLVLPEATLKRLATGDGVSISHYVSPIDGYERTAAFTRIPHSPFWVAVALAETDYLSDWRRDLRDLAVISGLALLALLLAWRVMRNFAADRDALSGDLERTEARYRKLFKSAPLPTLAIDRDSLRFLAVTDRACDLYGYSRHEFDQLTIADLIPEDDRARHALLGSGPSKLLSERELRHRRKDGTQFEAEQHLQLVEFDRRPAFLLTVENASEVRRTRHAATIAEAIFGHARESIMITDERQRIVDVNPGFTALTGYSRDEAIGRTPGILKSGAHDQEFYRAMWIDILAAGCWQGILRDRHKNGSVYDQLATIIAVKDLDGSVRNYIGIMTPIDRAVTAAGTAALE